MGDNKNAVGFEIVLDAGRFIFISYSRTNFEFVKKLQADLLNHGVNIWIDKIGLKAGTPDWDQALRDAIRQSNGVLLVASPESRRSMYVRDEIAIAKSSKKPILPIWAEGTDWIDCIPMGLGATQFVDMREGNYENGLAELIIALNNLTQSEPEYTNYALEEEIPVEFEPEKPYIGLNAFTEDNRKYFYGRSEFVQSLMGALQTTNFLAIVGPSGSGKSSVVMAGLLPRLKEDKHAKTWLYTKMVPGARPLENLTISLASLFREKSQRAIRDDLDAISKRGLFTMARELIRVTGQKIALYIDQFEELFTQTTDETERRQFIDLITTAVHEPNSPVMVIITLRADFYGYPLNYNDLGLLLEQNTKNILPMTLSELYEAIQEPANHPDVRLTFDPNLVNDIMFAVRDQMGTLPLLQFTLELLFDRRDGLRLTRQAYDDIGGVLGALAKHAEATYDVLSDAEKLFARTLFLRLIEPGETEVDTTRRRARLRELDLPDANKTAILKRVTDHFVQNRLLVSDKETIEVAHEAIIREWKRLADWLREHREDIEFQKTVSADALLCIQRKSPDMLYRGSVLEEAQGWLKRNDASTEETAFIQASTEHEQALIAKDKRRQRRLQIALLSLAVLVFLFAVMGVVFLSIQNQQQVEFAEDLQEQVIQAEQARDEAEEQRRASDSIALALNAQAVFSEGDEELAIFMALEAVKSVENPPAVVQRILADIAYNANFGGETLDNFGAPIMDMIYAPDGQTIFIGVVDGRLLSWSEASGITELFSTFGRFYTMEMTPDKRYILIGDELGRIYKYDIASQTAESYPIHSTIVKDIAILPDNPSHVLSGATDGSLIQWNLENGEVIQDIDNPNGSISKISILNGNTDIHFINGAFGRLVSDNLETDDLISKVKLTKVEDMPMFITAIANQQSDENMLTFLTASRHGILAGGQSYDSENVYYTFRNTISDNSIYDIAIHPTNPNLVATANHDGRVILFEISNNNQVIQLDEFVIREPIYSLLFSPNGDYLFAGTSSGDFVQIKIISDKRIQWEQNLNSETILGIIPTEQGIIIGTVINSEGGQYYQLFRATENEIVEFERMSVRETLRNDIVNFNEANIFIGLITETERVTLDKEKELTTQYTIDIYSESGYKLTELIFSEIDRVDSNDQNNERSNEGRQGTNRATIVVSKNNRYVAIAKGTTIVIWDITQDNSVPQDIYKLPETISQISFSDDGQYLAVGSFLGRVDIIHVPTSTWLTENNSSTLPVYNLQSITHLKFNPNNSLLVATSSDGRVWSINTTDNQILDMRFRIDGTINTLDFNPSGEILVIGASDGVVSLWDTQTGLNIRRYTPQASPIADVAFSDLGDTLYAVDSIGNVRAYNYQTLDELSAWATENLAKRIPTCDERDRYRILPFCSREDLRQETLNIGSELQALIPTTCFMPIYYHTDRTGDWELFRMGGIVPLNYPENISQGVGPDVFDIAPSIHSSWREYETEGIIPQEWIAFASTRDTEEGSHRNWEIYVVSITGDDTRRISFNEFAMDLDPMWAPNGLRLAYETTTDNGDWEIRVFDMLTGENTLVTNNVVNDINPFWSPDGTKILFQSDREDGLWQIYEIDLANDNAVTRISNGTGDDHDPMYSNDGTKIVFRSYRDDPRPETDRSRESAIYYMNVDGTGVTRVSEIGGNATNHVFSPDDSLIAYQSNITNDINDIYVYEIETGLTRLLTNNTGVDYQNVQDTAPAWYCDSSTLIITSSIDATDENVDNTNLFAVSVLPIDAPPISLDIDGIRLTTSEEVDRDALGYGSEENASRYGNVPPKWRP